MNYLKKIRPTGTVHENRINNCSITSFKVFEKIARGFYDDLFNKKNGILCLQWKDNACTILTKYDFVEPIYKNPTSIEITEN